MVILNPLRRNERVWMYPINNGILFVLCFLNHRSDLMEREDHLKINERFLMEYYGSVEQERLGRTYQHDMFPTKRATAIFNCGLKAGCGLRYFGNSQKT